MDKLIKSFVEIFVAVLIIGTLWSTFTATLTNFTGVAGTVMNTVVPILIAVGIAYVIIKKNLN